MFHRLREHGFSLTWDLLAIAGVALVTLGLWLWSTSLGLCFLGLAAIAAAYLGDRAWASSDDS